VTETGEGAISKEDQGKAAKSDPDDPPGAISNQNREEAPSELRDDQTHPEPRSRKGSPPTGG
jgi:hypothetical protein